MRVREAKSTDANYLSRLLQQVEASSEYMLWESGERQVTPEQQRSMIESMKERRNSTILIAEEDTSLVGYLFAIGGEARRNKHSAYIVVGISEDYRGTGLGTRLFNELEHWAIRNSIRRLELTVVSQNVAGISLYKKMGFEVEGIKRDSLIIGNEFVDEYYMSKLVPSVKTLLVK